jgi:predicted metalloprotease with PDZ domain
MPSVFSLPFRPAAFVLFALLGLCSCATDQPAPTGLPALEQSTAMNIHIRPNLADGKRVDSIDISILVPAPAQQAGTPLLSMAIMRVMAPGALDDPATLTASDDLGPLPLKIEEDPVDPTSFRQDRRWMVERTTEGDVHVSYTIKPRVITASTRPGPLIDTRTELSGFYGSGNTMLALPLDGWPRPVHIDWDLAEMAEGSRAASSLGLGSAGATVTLENLNNSFFMAGPLKSQPKSGEGEFAVFWMTPAAFDLEGAAEWTRAGYEYFVDFFGQDAPAFRIFMRTTERFQGGGGGGFNSFIFGTVEGEDRDPAEVRSLLAHETLHHFVGGYGDGGGAGGQQWYSEGATSYYTIVLPQRAGLTSTDEFIDAFNAHAVNYYTNPRSNLSNADVTALFFSDTNAQLVPYNRGPLYFALVDARVRQATHGAKRVDDLVFQFIASRDDATDAVALWRQIIVETLGAEGGAEFDGLMRGATLDFPKDMFGPCFAGKAQTLRSYALGFRPYRDEHGRTRAGPVTPDSPADKAGIARYDVISNPDVLARASEQPPGSAITLDIMRDGTRVTTSFSPWTEPKQGLQWLRNEEYEGSCQL